MSDRSAMLANAVAFLRDPELSNTPLERRLAFLQSKGLTPTEIEQAQAQAATTASPPLQSSALTPPPLPALPPPAQLAALKKQFSWRRLFLMIAVATSAAIALSQSVLPGWIRSLLSRLKSLTSSTYLETAESTGWIRESLQSIKQEVWELKEQLQQHLKLEMRSVREEVSRLELRLEQDLALQRLKLADEVNNLRLAYAHLQNQLESPPEGAKKHQPSSHADASANAVEVYHDAASEGGLVM